MQISWLGILALGITVADGFQDTSPFIFFSTSEILASSPQIIKAASLSQIVSTELQKCPSDIYVIVSQPNVLATDYRGRHSSPHLRKWVSGEDKRIRSSFTVTDVLGGIDTSKLADVLERKCGAGTLNVDASTGLFDIVDDMRPRIIKLDFPTLSTGPSRSQETYQNDLFLNSLLDILPSPNFTVIYTTTPVSVEHQDLVLESNMYKMDESSVFSGHTDLKRDVSIHMRAPNDNITLVDGPLFERYQYFTPALFMGLIVGLLLLMILYVGISGIANLQVSYAAFDKEMGPVAQKKQ